MRLPPIHPVVDEGLGNTTWLVEVGARRALVVDPPRDLRAVRALAEERGLTVAFAADTHLHADFLSGARQLGASDGAVVLASAAGRRAFPHRGLDDGDEVDLGGLTLEAVATPGHTDEHLSLVLRDGTDPLGVFTGGSLIVGSAARTDLLGADRTQELARAQYASLQRLTRLPDATVVWPTHGAGSFCSAPSGASRHSTIGQEKATNQLLAMPDADTFTERLTGSLGTYPAYFTRLAEVNRRGPAVVTGPPVLAGLTVARVRALLADGAVAVDVRPVPDVAAGRIPSAVAIPLRAQYATWLGWLLDPGTPIVIVRNPDQEPGDVVWPALNVGCEHLAGELAGGMRAWLEDGGEVATTRLVGPEGIPTSGVLDVRQRSEYADGHLPGATHVELGALTEHAGSIQGDVQVVMCGHGERAMTAASLLTRAGHRDPAVLVGGAKDWATATGQPLERDG